MASNTYKATVLVDFKTRGLDIVDKQIAKLGLDIQNALKVSTDAGLTKYVKTLDAAEKRVLKLMEQVSKYKDKLATVNENIAIQKKAPKPDTAKIQQLEAEKKLILQNINSAMAAYSQEKALINGVVGAIKNHNSMLSATIKKNIDMYKSLGGSKDRVKELNNMLRDQHKILAQPGGDKKIQAENAALEKQIAILSKIEEAKKAISESSLSKGVKDRMIGRLDTQKKQVSTAATPQIKSKDFGKSALELSKLVSDIAAKEDKVNAKIAEAVKLYGLSAKQAASLKKNLEDAAKVSLKSGSLKEFDKVKRDIDLAIQSTKTFKKQNDRLFDGTLADLDELQQQLQTLKLPKAYKDLLEGKARQTRQVAQRTYAAKTMEPTTKVKTLAGTRKDSSKLKSLAPQLAKDVEAANNLITKLKALGVEEQKVASLTAKLDAEFAAAVQAGNRANFSAFVKSLRDVVSNVNSASDAMKKLEGFENIELPDLTPEDTSVYKELTKDAATLRRKLLQLERSYEQQIGSMKRMIAVKSRWASTADIKKAEKALKDLEGKYNTIVNLQSQMGTLAKNNLLSSTWLKNMTSEANKLESSLYKDVEVAKNLKAELSKLSSIKWGANIVKRAVAYAGMYASIYQLISAMKSGLQVVFDFDKSMRTISAVFEITEQSARALHERLVGLGKAWGGSMQDIEAAAMALGRAGIASDKLVKATEVVIKMARLTGDSINVSSDAIITYTQVYGNAGKSIEQLGDQLAYVANQSRLSTQDIGTFSNYALAAAKAAGFTMEMVNAMAVSFSNAGVNASTIGTQIRRFASLLRDNSTAAKEFFMKIGTSQEFMRKQFAQGGEVADRTMIDFVKRLKEMSNVEFSKTIQGMDILASQSITLIRNNADEFLRHFKRLKAGVDGELAKSDFIAQSYAATWEKVKTAVGDAFAKLMEGLMPTLVDIGNATVELLDKFTSNIDNVKAAIDGLIAAFKALGIVIVATIGTSAISAAYKLGAAYLQLIPTIGRVTTTIRTLNSTTVAASSLAVGVVGGVGTGAAQAATKVGLLAGAFRILGVAGRFLLGWPGLLLSIGYGIYEWYNSTKKTTTAVKELTGSYKELKTIQDQIAENDDAIRKERAKLWEVTNKIKTANNEEKETLYKQREAIIANIYAIRQRNDELETQQQIMEKSVQLEDTLYKIKAKKAERAAYVSDNGDIIDLDQYTRLGRELEDLTVKSTRLKKELQVIKLKKQYRDLVSSLTNLSRVMEENKNKVPISTYNSWAKTQARLKEELNKTNAELKALEQTAQGTAKSLEIVTKDMMKQFSQYNKDIRVLIKAGMPITNMLVRMNNQFMEYLRIMENELNVRMGTFSQIVLQQFAGLPADIQSQLQPALESLFSTWNSFMSTNDPNQKAYYLLELKQKVEDIKAAIPQGEQWQSMRNALEEIISMSNQGIEKITTLSQEAANTTNKATQAFLSKYNDQVQGIKARMKELKDQFNKGFDIGPQLQQLQQDVLTAYNNMKQLAAQQAKGVAKAALDALDKEWGRIQQLHKEGVISDEQLESIKQARKDLEDVARGKKGPEAAKRAVDILNAALKATGTTAEILTAKLNGVAQAFSGLLGYMGTLDSLNQGFTIDLLGGPKALKAYTAAVDGSLKPLYDMVPQGNKKLQRSAKKTKAAQKELTKAFEDNARALGMNPRAAELAAEKAGILTGRVKTLRTKLDDFKNGVGGGGGAAGAAETLTDKLREIRRAIDENLGVGTAWLDFLDEQKDMMKKISEAGGGSDLYLEWLRSYKKKMEFDQADTAANMVSGGPLGDPYGFASDSAETYQKMLEQEKVINEFYERQAAMYQLQQEILNQELQQGLITRDQYQDEFRQLDLEKEAAYQEQKKALQQNTMDMYLSFTKNTLAGVDAILTSLMNSGYIHSKKMFEFIKALRVAQAIIDTYAAANKALAETGIPTWQSYINAALAIAKGMANVAMIKAQQMPTKYHTGGYVDAVNGQKEFNSTFTKMGGLRDDEIPAILQKGEYVLSRDDIRNIKNAKYAVNDTSTPQQINVDVPQTEVVVINAIDDSVMEQWAQSRTGREIINNVISR